MKSIADYLTPDESALLESLATPAAIQAYLDATPYSPEDHDRCPLNVIRDRVAHCLDGGLFAAMALRRLGYPALIVDLLPEPDMDDDHVLAVFRKGKGWGAIAKSNFIGLRYREPVYRDLRELVMSYFEDFFNVDGLKTLRGYTLPLNLAQFDRFGWTWQDEGVKPIVQRMGQIRRFSIIDARAPIAGIMHVDDLSYRAGMLVANPAGLYKPKRPAGAG